MNNFSLELKVCLGGWTTLPISDSLSTRPLANLSSSNLLAEPMNAVERVKYAWTLAKRDSSVFNFSSNTSSLVWISLNSSNRLIVRFLRLRSVVSGQMGAFSCIYVLFDGLDKIRLSLGDNTLENFAKNMNRTLLSHCIHVQFLKQWTINSGFIFNCHFEFTDCFQSPMKSFNLLLISSIFFYFQKERRRNCSLH